MSFFSSLKTAFEDIYNLFKKFFKNEPTWAQVATTDIAYVAPIIGTIATLVGGPAADAEVTTIVTAIQNDLVLATKFIQAMDSSSNLVDVLTGIQNNLQSLLQLAAVKNSSEVNTITAYTTGIIGELTAIINALPKLSA